MNNDVRTRSYVMVLTILVLLPGCRRIINWGRDHFVQGEKRPIPMDIVKDHIRSCRVYDTFDTLGLFDVLWLSDEIRRVYTDIYAAKVGKTEDEKEIFLEAELNENKKYISFYVVSIIPTQDHNTLGDKLGPWMIQLSIDNVRYQPKSIKEVTLSTEYTMMLHKYWNRQKTVYLVKFDATCQGKPIINPTTDEIILVLNTIDRSCEMHWNIEDMHTAKNFSRQRVEES